jgi:hypothetical protein
MRLDDSICRKTFASIVSPRQYSQWLSTGGVHAIAARDSDTIIGQRWAHPLGLYDRNVPVSDSLYWIHNTKVLPTWQNKGVYQQMVGYFDEAFLDSDDTCLFLVSVKNSKMRYLATKMGFSPRLAVCFTVIPRYLFNPKFNRIIRLCVVRSSSPPGPWMNTAFSNRIHWIPRFSWDPSPEWFSFHNGNQLLATFQLAQPVHPVQGRHICAFKVQLYTAQLRYLSCMVDRLKNSPSLVKSIFYTLFKMFPRLHAVVTPVSSSLLAKFLHVPEIFLRSEDYILYSNGTDRSDRWLPGNNLEFFEGIIPLDGAGHDGEE